MVRRIMDGCLNYVEIGRVCVGCKVYDDLSFGSDRTDKLDIGLNLTVRRIRGSRTVFRPIDSHGQNNGPRKLKFPEISVKIGLPISSAKLYNADGLGAPVQIRREIIKLLDIRCGKRNG